MRRENLLDRRQMKKLMCLGLAAAMLVSAGCGSGAGVTDDTASDRKPLSGFPERGISAFSGRYLPAAGGFSTGLLRRLFCGLLSRLDRRLFGRLLCRLL